MKTKKHPKANLENYSKLFAQLGLVLTLVIVYVLIENKTFTNQLTVLNNSGLNTQDNSAAIIEYQIEPPKIEVAPQKSNLQEIKKIDNEDVDFTETIIEPIDTESPIDISQIVEVEPIDDTVEDVDFIILEDAPTYPGCTGTKDEMKTCFSDKITKFISKNFDGNLAEELGLSPGIQRIYVIFKIDNTGKIVDIKARAPHIKLQEEAIRVVELLPQMEPGKQRGKPVNVKYSLPITFKIE
jgi:protein TonB